MDPGTGTRLDQGHEEEHFNTSYFTLGTFQLKLFHLKHNLNCSIISIPCLVDQKQRLMKKGSRISEQSPVEGQIYYQAGLFFFPFCT